MEAFDKFISDNKDSVMRVTKLKNLENPENHTSDIPRGEGFEGQVSLRWFEESDWGKGFVILVNGGFTMRTSLVREVVRKGPSRWLAKTLNSVYRVEVVK